MTTRTHLSISEVLSLLKEDFPDLTITKIRYLESQGLIDPERTASGYRKFYKFDIERLRWILRQQRENFLPLKVIKKRLDSTDGKESGGEPEPADQPELDLARDPGRADPPPVWMADHAKATGKTKNDGETVSEPTDVPPPTPPTVADESGTTSHHQPSTPSSTTDATATVAAKPPPVSPKHDRPTPPVPTAQAERPKPGPTSSDNAKVSVAPQPDMGPSDVSLTRAELLKASGLSDRQLADCETFGIVVGTEGPNSETYGSSALICARHASTLLDLGIEARHLRAYKVAADREAGLYEQLLLPLLRQRNPAARAEAIQTLERVTKAGSAIHASLLKQALRRMHKSPN